MQLHILLLFFFFTRLNGQANITRTRDKRAILDLGDMIKCGTGRSALMYLGYGCYCGLGGRGVPKDQADWCCYQHDCCYGVAENEGCQSKLESYDWTCHHNKYIQCGRRMGKCQRIACYCDKELAKCLSRAPFNKKYYMLPNFLCSKGSLSCKYRGYGAKSGREK